MQKTPNRPLVWQHHDQGDYQQHHDQGDQHARSYDSANELSERPGISRGLLRLVIAILAIGAIVLVAAVFVGCVPSSNPTIVSDTAAQTIAAKVVASATTQQAADSAKLTAIQSQLSAAQATAATQPTPANASQVLSLQSQLVAAQAQASSDSAALKAAVTALASATTQIQADTTAIKTQQGQAAVNVTSATVGSVNPLWGAIVGIGGTALVGGLAAFFSSKSGTTTAQKLETALQATISAGVAATQAHATSTATVAQANATTIQQLGAGLAASVPANLPALLTAVPQSAQATIAADAANTAATIQNSAAIIASTPKAP